MNDIITIPVTFRCLHRKNAGGTLHMHITDCYGDVTDDAGDIMGRVGASIGAAIDIEVNGELWSVKGLDLWQAFEKVRNAPAESGAEPVQCLTNKGT